MSRDKIFYLVVNCTLQMEVNISSAEISSMNRKKTWHTVHTLPIHKKKPGVSLKQEKFHIKQQTG